MRAAITPSSLIAVIAFTALAPSTPAVPATAATSVDRRSTITLAALKAAATDTMARRYYRATQWRRAWSSIAAQQLDGVLADRARHGLDRIAFLPTDLPSLSPAEQDVARTRAALAYASALAHGRVDPASLHSVYTLPRADAVVVSGLAKALNSNALGDWLNALAPQDDAYQRLSQSYVAMMSDTNTRPAIEATNLIKPGESNSRLPEIVAQLRADDYLPNGQSQSEVTIYTQAAVNAVTQLQRDYGITADGVIGPDTLKVLNFGPDDRVRALAVALERRRWLSRTPPVTRIDVNVAAARLRYYREGKLVDERKVIVGKPGNETPPLLAPIYRLVANPTWTVPKSIQHGDLAGVSSEYLKRHNMVMRGGWIVQQPGPANALGMVKFDMRDDVAIYLHDTSNRALFDRSQRHLSHGCVRVEDALGFADRLAREEGVADQWQQARASGKRTFVPLPREIPVRLLYHNVFVSADGNVTFRTDPYGWNEPIAAALGFTPDSKKRAVAQNVDVGP